MLAYPIEIPLIEIADFCRRNGIRRLALFGSVLRDDFQPNSDIDVLVEFEPGIRLGLRFFSLERELSQLLGREVELSTPAFLSDYFRDEVLQEAENIYVAA
jgi:predicted nucleotidyltransferase